MSKLSNPPPNSSSLQLAMPRPPRCAAVVAALAMTFAAAADAATPESFYTTGPSSNRVDIVFAAEGYTNADHNGGAFATQTDDFVDHLFEGFWSDPFPRYRNFFNATRLPYVSAESGADAPLDPAYPDYVDTYFDAEYVGALGSTDDRLIVFDQNYVQSEVNGDLAGTGIGSELRLLIVNSDKYGGSGGDLWAGFAGDNSFAGEVGMHELAHHFANLADEYDGNTTPYVGAEPSEPNVSRYGNGMKWDHWVGFDDPRASYLDITTEEGARYYNEGLYRPSQDSTMRSPGSLFFNAVSREAIILSIYEYVDPLDDWLRSTSVIGEELWVDVVDPDVIAVDWYVDGQLVPDADGETFHPADFGFAPGDYTVEARAYDSVIDHYQDGSLLDLVRKNFQDLRQSVSWNYQVRVAGDFDENGVVDEEDYDLWVNKYGEPSPGWFGNRNGVVDAGDFTLFRDTYGDKQPSGPALVPEPTTWLLTSLGALAGACRRRRPLAG